MDPRRLTAVRVPILACILFLTACDGRLTAEPRDVDVGEVLVHYHGVKTTNFRAVTATVEFRGRRNVAGPHAAMFTVEHSMDPLEPGRDSLVAVHFRPTAAGRKSAEYTPRLLAGEASAGSFPLRLSGNGVTRYQASPSSVTWTAPREGLDFQDVCVSTSRSLTLNVTNTTADAVQLLALFHGGTPAITVDPADLTIPANDTKDFTLRFTPERAQAYDASLMLRDPVRAGDLLGVWMRGVGKNC